MMNKVDFGRLLREARQDAHLSRMQAADAVDCAYSIIENAENGEEEIMVSLLVDLAQLYNKSIAYFFGEELSDLPGVKIAPAELRVEQPHIEFVGTQGSPVPGFEQQQYAPGSMYVNAFGARVPVVGERVLYCMDRDSSVPGRLRPADVVHVWGGVSENIAQETADLVVILNGLMDYPGDAGNKEHLHVRKTSCNRYRGVVPANQPGHTMPWGSWVFPEQVDYTSAPQI